MNEELNLIKVGRISNTLNIDILKCNLKKSKIQINAPCRVNTFLCHHDVFLSPPRSNVYPVGSISFGVKSDIFINIELLKSDAHNIYCDKKYQDIALHAVMIYLKTIGVNDFFKIDLKKHSMRSHSGMGTTSAIFTGIVAGLNEIYGKPLSVQQIVKLVSQNYGEESSVDGYLSKSASTGGSVAISSTGRSIACLYGESEIGITLNLPDSFKLITLYPVNIKSIDKSDELMLEKREKKMLGEIDKFWGETKERILKKLIIPDLQSEKFDNLFKVINMYTIGAYGNIPEYFDNRWQDYGLDYSGLIKKIYRIISDSKQTCFFISSNGPTIAIITNESEKFIKKFTDEILGMDIQEHEISRVVEN